MTKTNTKCFALLTGADETPTPSRWKPATKKHGPQVSLGGDEFINATCVGDVKLSDTLTLEFWQTCSLNANTTLDEILNLPICSSFLVFPVIFRVVGSTDIPTLGRIKKLLCEQVEHMMTHQFIRDEEEEALEDDPHYLITSSTTIEEEEDDLDLDSHDEDEPDDLEDDGMDLDDEEVGEEEDEESDISIDDD